MSSIKNSVKQYIYDHPKLMFILDIWRRIIYPFPSNLKSFLHHLPGILLETDIFFTPTKKNISWDQLAITLRYRSLSLHLPLSKNEKQLLSLHNIHKGKRAFLIGNGPSLNACDLSHLKDEITIGVNAIYLNQQGFNPKYYIVEDVAVADDRHEEIRAYDKPEYKFFGNYLKSYFEGTPNTLWLNVRLNYMDSKRDCFPYFSTNAAIRVWVGGTVSYIGMQLAYYLGIKELYLIGFDHNYIIPSSIIQKGTVFTSTESDPNHFDGEYFGKGYTWHDPQVNRMERSYRKAKTYYEYDNRKIYNATVGGKLEVFERVDYNSLFRNS